MVHLLAGLRLVFETVAHGVVVVGVLVPSVPLLQHRLEIFQDLLLLRQVALSVKQLVDFAQLVDHLLCFVLQLEGLDHDVNTLLIHRGRA